LRAGVNSFKNLEKDGEALKIILNMSQLYNAEPLDPVFTMPSWEAIKKIDHILADDSLTFLEGENLQLTASDHLPYWASFKRNDKLTF
jgi:endonuclease/exonuclease/phosphatase family metal-dependent hydrolase